jgi:hypothetical protein
MGKFTWGGFIAENIMRWFIKECYESGDPMNFLRAVEDTIDVIRDDIDTLETIGDVNKYWEHAYNDTQNN